MTLCPGPCVLYSRFQLMATCVLLRSWLSLGSLPSTQQAPTLCRCWAWGRGQGPQVPAAQGRVGHCPAVTAREEVGPRRGSSDVWGQSCLHRPPRCTGCPNRADTESTDSLGLGDAGRYAEPSHTLPGFLFPSKTQRSSDCPHPCFPHGETGCRG